MSSSLSRRGLLKAAGIAIAAGAVSTATPARAQGRILGTVLDYAGGVPSAAAVRAAGHIGAVRYVSQPRPGAEWMVGKPVSLTETRDFARHSLSTASVYQFGKADTADWKQGAAGAAIHAPQAINLHQAAGGPTGRPIYVAIDDNPTHAEYTNQIRPYLQAFSVALNASGYSLGIYGNYHVIDWAVADGLGTHYWMHNWGSGGRIHPRTTLHQVRIDKDRVDGVLVDINNVYAQDWGQWQPGSAAAPTAPAEAATSSLPVGGSSISADDVRTAANLAQQISGLLP